MTFARGDIFRVICALHPILQDAAARRWRMVIESVRPLDDMACVALLDAAGDKTASATVALEHLRTAFLLREDLLQQPDVPAFESVWRAINAQRQATGARAVRG